MNESATDPTRVVAPTARVGYMFGLLGMIVGMIGLAAAIASPYLVEASKPPAPQPQKLADKLAEAGDKFVGRMIDRARDKQPAPVVEPPAPKPPTPWGSYASLVAAALGLVGALFGTVGWIRREDHRLAASSIVIGSLAVTWLYIVAGIIIASVIVFVLLLLSAISG